MQTIQFKNYKLTFDEKNGKIKSICSGNDILELRGSIWKIQQSDNSELSIDDMEEFSCELDNTAILSWKGSGVRVSIEIFEENSQLKSQINVISDNKALNRVVYPMYNAVEKISDDDYLVLPWQNGFLIKNPIDNFLNTDTEIPFWMGRGGKKYENEYPAQYSYQFFSYYANGGKGYYMACEDGKAYIKTIGFAYNETYNAMDIYFINYPENMGEAKVYTMPYSCVFSFIDGDWQNAAKMYRKWAVAQKWYTPLAERNIPKAVEEIDFFRINHEHYALGTRSDEYIETCRMIRDKLSCNPAMHWYGWNKAPVHGDWYPYMADYSNAQWRKELHSINATLTNEGIKKIPYVNVHLMDKNLEKTKGLTPSLVSYENNLIEDEPWGRGNLFAVCHATSEVKNTALELFDRLVNEDGFDGIYIDQVASFNATLCFDKTHGHPIGGGSWWSDEYHKMLGSLRRTMPKNKFLTTESCCECYHDLFDIFLILDTCSQTNGFHEVCGCENCESIPLFAMIYKDSALAYGSICSFENNDSQFEFNFMRNILWGMIPTCEGMELEMIEKDLTKWDIIKRGVDFYKSNKELLIYGTFEEYIKLDDDSRIIEFGSFKKKCPGVICAIYRYDGEKTAMLYNFSESDRTVTVKGNEICVPSRQFISYKI